MKKTGVGGRKVEEALGDPRGGADLYEGISGH